MAFYGVEELRKEKNKENKSGFYGVQELRNEKAQQRRETYSPDRREVFNSASETSPSGRMNLQTAGKNLQNKLAPVQSDPVRSLKEDVTPLRIQQPELQRSYNPVSTPESRRNDWVEERLESDRKGASSSKALSAVNEFLEPVSRAVYTGASYLAPLTKGAGNALGVQANTAEYNPTVGNKIMEGVGAVAGSLTNPTNLSQGVASLGLRTGSHLAQRAGQATPLLNNRLSQRAIEGATAGAAQGALISGARGETDAKELATNIGLGAAFGAAGDVALTGIAKGVNSLRRTPQQTIAPQVNVESSLPKTVTRTGNVKKAPENWFESLFGQTGVGIAAGQKGNKNLIDTHVTRNAVKKGNVIERTKDAASVAHQDYVDQFVPFKAINDETYDAAMDSTRANNLANVTIKDKFVDLEGNVRGNSLKDVYSLVPRGQKDLADRYLIMRDAINRMERGIKVYGDEPWFPQTADDAARMVAELESKSPWLRQFGDEWNQFNRNRQDLWVESGLVSQDLIETLRQTNPNYTPMQRQMNKLSSLFRTKQGFSGQNAGIKKAVGSSKKIVEPAQSMINSTAKSYHAMMRNRAMQKLYNSVMLDPERYRGIIEIVEETDDVRQSTLKRLNEALENDGVDGIADMLNDEMNLIFNKSKQKSSTATDNFVTVMLDGQPVKMNVMESSLLRAIEGVSPEQLTGVLKIIDFLSRGVKQAATGALAPLQGAKLFARDIPVAFAQSKDKVRFLGDISQAMVSQIADWLPTYIPGAENLGRLAREYYRAGGGYEQYLRGDSKIRAAASDITRDPLLSGRNLWKQTKKYNPLRPLKELGDAFENIPRIAAFQAAMRKNGWSRDEATVRKALNEAREATVNWSRKGAKGQQIESVLPYSNAAVQGTYRLAKFIKEQPVSALGMMTAVTGASIASYEQYKDDPDYQHRNKYAQGIIVGKREDGKFITVPVEPSYQFIADQVLNFYAWAKDQQEMPNAKESIQEGFDALTPKYIAGPVSTFTGDKNIDPQRAVATTLGGSSLEPLVATSTGKNYFGGDIVPREYQSRSTEHQQNETTSAAANWAAENLGMDAFTFDYLGQKFGGDLAKILLPMTSEVGKGDPLGNIADESLARLKLLEDPVMSNNLSEEYYKLADKVTRAKADVSAGAELPSWYQDVYDSVTSTKKGSIAKAISELNAEKKNIQRDPSLSAKDRASDLREVQTEINLLRIKAIEIMEKAMN